MLFSDAKAIHARAWFLGTRIELRALERGETLSLTPLTIRTGARGYAMLFRYGAVVVFELLPVEEATFLETLGPFISERFDKPESEIIEIVIDPCRDQRVDLNGRLVLHEASLERLQIVAHILAKSTVLAHYEEYVTMVFDQMERLTERLRHHMRHIPPGRELLRQVGDVLLMQTRTVGRVEVTEKPELTWDYADLDRLYERLGAEYELRDRDRALTRKLELITRTAETYLNLLQSRQTLRVEWYIVILILVEIVLIVYDLFIAR